MPKGITNIAASVHQRLLNKAKELSRPFNELLQYFAIVDIGFGDIVVPDAGTVLYPTILDFQAPELKGYTMESTIAEKFQAMIKLGILNSRMKDFYDIWFLSHTFDFKGEILCEAIKKTFSKRKTPIDLEGALFDPLFGIDRGKDVQWRAFIRKAKLNNPPETFEETVVAVKRFLETLAITIAEQKRFNKIWTAPGPWANTSDPEGQDLPP